MQCGCPECGVLMAQVQKGLDSACKCPECGHECRACLGRHEGAGTPVRKGISREEWELILKARRPSQ